MPGVTAGYCPLERGGGNLIEKPFFVQPCPTIKKATGLVRPNLDQRGTMRPTLWGHHSGEGRKWAKKSLVAGEATYCGKKKHAKSSPAVLNLTLSGEGVWGGGRSAPRADP